MRDFEAILPRRAVPQPTPTIYDGGDCGACVFAGMLGIGIEEAYDLQGEVKPFAYSDIRGAIYEAERRDIIDRTMMAVPLWISEWHDVHGVWGFPSWQQNQAWFSYVTMALDAGYYGIAHVSHGKEGPLNYTDHVVLICGARVRRKPHESFEGANTIIQEVLVSCSSTTTPDEEWVHHRDFLTERGGFNAVWARPS